MYSTVFFISTHDGASHRDLFSVKDGTIIFKKKRKINTASLRVHSNQLSNGHHRSICYILHSYTQIKHILCFVFLDYFRLLIIKSKRIINWSLFFLDFSSQNFWWNSLMKLKMKSLLLFLIMNNYWFYILNILLRYVRVFSYIWLEILIDTWCFYEDSLFLSRE
jgi:hypothetical protein